MRRAVLFLLTGLLAGCGNQLAARQAALSRLVGQPVTVLVQQYGVPDRTYETDGVKYLAYKEHRVDIVPGFPDVQPGLYRVVWRRLPAASGRSALRDHIRSSRWHGEGIHAARQCLRLISSPGAR